LAALSTSNQEHEFEWMDRKEFPSFAKRKKYNEDSAVGGIRIQQSEFARSFAFHTGLLNQTRFSAHKTGDIEKPIAMIEKAVKGIRNQLTRFESIPSFETYWTTFLRVVVAEKGHEIATTLYEKLFKRIKLTKVKSGLYDYERTFQYAAVFHVGKLVLENTYKNEDIMITMNRMDLLELGDYQLTTNQTTLQQLKEELELTDIEDEVIIESILRIAYVYRYHEIILNEDTR